jgi:hypothetical protein
MSRRGYSGNVGGSHPDSIRVSGFALSSPGAFSRTTPAQYAYLKARETATDTCNLCGAPALYKHFPRSRQGMTLPPVGRCRFHKS